jgi:hypothetical protein
MCAAMSAPPTRLLAAMLLLGAALTGCGKAASINGQGGAETSGGVSAVGPAGAAGIVTSNTTRLGGADPVLDAAAVARTVHPGLTAATQPQAVVLVDEHDWPAALAASVLAGAPAGAPLLYSEGDTLPAISAQALEAMRPLGAAPLGGAQLIEIGNSAPAPPGVVVHHVEGGSPFVLAADVEQLQSTLDGGRRTGQVIIVDVDGSTALAMPAAGLAASSGAPILFVTARGIPAATRHALVGLNQPSIYAIGPTSAIDGRVLGELARYGPVRRIEGPDAVQNAIAVAHFSDGSFGWGVDEPGHGLVFASQARPLDAPAAASLSASGDYGPLLLLERPDEVPQALASYLSDIQPAYGSSYENGPVRGVYNHGWLIGGQQAISAAVQGELDSLLGSTHRTIPAGQPSEAP